MPASSGAVLRRILLTVASFVVLAVPAGASASTTLDYPDFSSLSGLQLNGNAFQNGDQVRLTNWGGNQAGSVYATTPVDATDSWSASYRLHFNGSADGGGFVLQSQGPGALSPSWQYGGSGHAYAGVVPHVAIDFDVYRGNSGISVGYDSPQGGTRIPFPSSGDTDWYVWTDYSASDHRLRVTYSQHADGSDPQYLSQDVDIASVFGSSPVYAGIAGATGGSTMAFDVLSFHFGALSDAAAAPNVATAPKDVRQRSDGSGSTSGSFSSLVDSPLTITADHPDVGTLTDNGDGTWSWASNPASDATGPQTITVTATDAEGRTTTTTFGFTPYVPGQIGITLSQSCVPTGNPYSPVYIDVTANGLDPNVDYYDVVLVQNESDPAWDNWNEAGFPNEGGQGETSLYVYPYWGTYYGTGTMWVKLVSAYDWNTVIDEQPISFKANCASDTTPPVVTVPGDQKVEATGPGGAPASFAASANDNVDGSIPASCSTPSGSTFALGTTTVTCTATDKAGNTGSSSFKVQVVDSTAPAFDAPKDVVAEATGPDGAKASYDAPKTTDAVDGAGTASCAPASGSTFALGATTVTCTATDAAGNSRTKTFGVTVSDTTPPDVKVADRTVEATGPDGAAVDLHATASDLVDGAVPATCSPASGGTFALGSTDVTCTATDAHGNKGTGAATVKVVDTTAPAIAPHADASAEATGPNGAAVSYDAPKTTDAVDGAGTAACAPASGSTFALGTTTVTCTATDAHNNAAKSTFAVKVVDTTPPKLALPADISAVASSAQGAKVTYAASAADVVDGSDPVSCSNASGSQFALGTTTVTCTSTDNAGNPVKGSFQVTVAYAWSGFLDPIKNNALTGNLGRTVPVKFTLTGASAGITNATGQVLIGLQGKALAPAVSTDKNVTGIRYTDGQYLFNLNTKGLAAGVYTVRVDLGDGVKRDATLTLS